MCAQVLKFFCTPTSKNCPNSIFNLHLANKLIQIARCPSPTRFLSPTNSNQGPVGSYQRNRIVCIQNAPQLSVSRLTVQEISAREVRSGKSRSVTRIPPLIYAPIGLMSRLRDPRDGGASKPTDVCLSARSALISIGPGTPLFLIFSLLPLPAPVSATLARGGTPGPPGVSGERGPLLTS